MDVGAKEFLAYFQQRRAEMRKLKTQERDARWYREYESGKSQKQIAEENGVAQSYVSLRIKTHKDRNVNDPIQDKFKMAAILSMIVPEEYRVHCRRFDAITEDLYEDPCEMRLELFFAMQALGAGMLANIGESHLNPHGDFVRAAFHRYAKFDSQFNDLGLRK